MPRPDVQALGTEYRRIPLLAIGTDIYLDTRLILQKLEQLFPASAVHPSLSAKDPDQKAFERLFESWTIDAGIFNRASQLFPTSLPLLKDDKFIKDRESYTGRSWRRDAIDAMRPEALVEIKNAFTFLEETLLADGRDWILKTQQPSLSDIEAVWPFHYLQGLKVALPPDQISAQQYPKVFAWLNRFQKAVSQAKKSNPELSIKGREAVSQIGSSELAEPEGVVDSNDPTGLRRGQEVQVWPIDTGFRHKDRGRVLTLTTSEIVIESSTDEGKPVRIHAPRHGFRIKAVGNNANAKL